MASPAAAAMRGQAVPRQRRPDEVQFNRDGDDPQANREAADRRGRSAGPEEEREKQAAEQRANLGSQQLVVEQLPPRDRRREEEVDVRSAEGQGGPAAGQQPAERRDQHDQQTADEFQRYAGANRQFTHRDRGVARRSESDAPEQDEIVEKVENARERDEEVARLPQPFQAHADTVSDRARRQVEERAGDAHGSRHDSRAVTLRKICSSLDPAPAISACADSSAIVPSATFFRDR